VEKIRAISPPRLNNKKRAKRAQRYFENPRSGEIHPPYRIVGKVMRVESIPVKVNVLKSSAEVFSKEQHPSTELQGDKGTETINALYGVSEWGELQPRKPPVRLLTSTVILLSRHGK